MMIGIEHIHARQILDSRGNPTVEVDVILNDGRLGRAAAPSGALTGEHEAVGLREGDKSRYPDQAVTKAVSNVNRVIAPKLPGTNPCGQEAIDRTMPDLDGTETKAKPGRTQSRACRRLRRRRRHARPCPRTAASAEPGPMFCPCR